MIWRPLGSKLKDLKKVVKRSEAMSFRELYRYVQKVETEGYDATAYRVDLHAKLAFPVVCVIMSMVGIGIAARGRLTKGLPASIALGIGTALSQWAEERGRKAARKAPPDVRVVLTQSALSSDFSVAASGLILRAKNRSSASRKSIWSSWKPTGIP